MRYHIKKAESGVNPKVRIPCNRCWFLLKLYKNVGRFYIDYRYPIKKRNCYGIAFKKTFHTNRYCNKKLLIDYAFCIIYL